MGVETETTAMANGTNCGTLCRNDKTAFVHELLNRYITQNGSVIGFDERNESVTICVASQCTHKTIM